MYDTVNNSESSENIRNRLYMAARTNKSIMNIEALIINIERELASNHGLVVETDISFLGIRSELASFKNHIQYLKNVAKTYKGPL